MAYQYLRTGNPDDIKTQTTPGAALMGGGADLDSAFKWLCDRANGGDFLVLRASGDDEYNKYVQGLCKTNSVATLILPDKAAAEDPFVAAAIHNAEAIFIAGGDQSSYIKFWKGTPVETAINDRLRAGVPIGGTSAGMAVLGEFVFSAMHDTATSKETLADPYNDGVTLTSDFLHLPYLGKTITDQHFVSRDRLGRTVAFMARILQDGMSDTIRAIAVDERNAVLVDEKGDTTLIGDGNAYFFRPKHKPEVCRAGTPLTFRDIQVYKIDHKATFTLKDWSGSGGTWYVLSAIEGKLQSSNGSVY